MLSLFTFQIQLQDRKRRNTEQHLERHDPADDHGEEEVEEERGEEEEEEEPGRDEEGVQQAATLPGGEEHKKKQIPGKPTKNLYCEGEAGCRGGDWQARLSHLILRLRSCR